MQKRLFYLKIIFLLCYKKFLGKDFILVLLMELYTARYIEMWLKKENFQSLLKILMIVSSEVYLLKILTSNLHSLEQENPFYLDFQKMISLFINHHFEMICIVSLMKMDLEWDQTITTGYSQIKIFEKDLLIFVKLI